MEATLKIISGTAIETFGDYIFLGCNTLTAVDFPKAASNGEEPSQLPAERPSPLPWAE
jgi:hypothetical protein